MTSIPGWEDAGDLPSGGVRPTSPVDLFHDLSGATAYAAAEPRRRWTHEAKGRVLFFPRTGMTMVPFELHRNGDWSCVVVDSGLDPARQRSYPVGGYHLNVGCAEIETAIEVSLVSSLALLRLGRALVLVGRVIAKSKAQS